MKKIKVRIYKDPNGQGSYINKTSQFLQKAKYGMEKKYTEEDINNTILDELTLDPDPDSIAYKLEGLYGLNYNDALDKISEVQDILYKEGTGESKTTVDALLPEQPIDNNRANRYDYGLNQTSVVDDSNYEGDTGWEDEESMPMDDLAQEDENALSIEKTGGAIGKRKFVKKLVTDLRKAAEGMEQNESSSATITDIPVGGRQNLINNFRRGVKDLGNKYYADEIYNKMQGQNTPEVPMQKQAPMFAQNGAQVVDPENFTHHLKALSEANSNIFDQPMNQTHGAGFEDVPEAKKGREQRQADRQARNVDKDFNRAFGDMAAGYFGVPGMPNYMQVISPQIVQGQMGSAPARGSSGPLIDLEYKKGPWWTGKREWSAKGIPMMAFGQMPMQAGPSYDNYKTYPGEVVRTKSRVLNAAADPTINKSSTALNNNPAANPIATDWANSSLQGSLDRAYDEYDEWSSLPTFDSRRGFIPSGKADVANTGVDESKVWSNPFSEAEYNKVYGKYYGDNFQDIANSTPEEREILQGSSYLARDSKGNEYSINNTGSPEYLDEQSRLSDRYDTLDEANNLLEQFNPRFLPRQDNGGFVDTSTMDPNTLARFIYGGGDNQSIEPIISYDDNYSDTKNTQDPYYSRGGMFKYAGDEQSEVTPGTTTPAWKDLTQEEYNKKLAQEKINWKNEYVKQNQQQQQGNGAGIRASTPAPGYTWEEWNALPEATRTKIGQSLQGQRTQTQGGYYPQGNYGYPTAQPLGQQLMDMFSIYKRNPYTGSKTDFSWLSQNGPARTMDGQVYQPQGQQGATQNQRWAEATDKNGNKKLMTLDQAEREGLPHKEVQASKQMMGQQNLMQPGYVQDYKFEKGPWWSGNKKSLSVTNRWQDPNAQASNTGIFGGKGPTAPVQSQSAFSPGDPRGEYMKSQLTLPAQPVVSQPMPKDFPANNVGPMNSEMAYGGYVPDYNDLYEFQGMNDSQVDVSGTGPSNPNKSNISNGGMHIGQTGPCTEFEVSDPNSPCYDPNYLSQKANATKPQDFQVKYDINDAKTLDLNNIANLNALGQTAIQGVSGINDNLYSNNYANANTTSDNMAGVNNLDYRGGKSGLTGRKQEPGFTGIVGNASFAKKGGQSGYSEGGVYDLSQEEIGKILAAGGQIKFL